MSTHRSLERKNTQRADKPAAWDRCPARRSRVQDAATPPISELGGAAAKNGGRETATVATAAAMTAVAAVPMDGASPANRERKHVSAYKCAPMVVRSHTISNRIKNHFPTCDALPPIPLTRLSRRPLKTEDVWLSPQMATVAAGAARSSLRSAFRFAGIRRAPGLAAGLSELAGIRAQGFHHRRRR